MADVLITVRLPAPATLEAAMRRLGLAEDEVDAAYGLVPVDPARDLYVLRVTEDAGRRVGGGADGGPFSDPPIEPYGPPR
ncbi:hypothetical protein GCM10010116_46660 [Microbispora rosea subsp. aerata]|nr:hypothetical protein [Microbispora rosea]GGO23117.1 hypothetical protein GCM10010116_46660 [Microbispora rosea subsp. aerata]GIH57716.1 hypothetical protein Mro02_46300 [Microbispora rosea subsp. aerata]GLJ84083.1 hypothetical protein GCM10017588_28110 [Microbispora rosea subsp. aerata]